MNLVGLAGCCIAMYPYAVYVGTYTRYAMGSYLDMASVRLRAYFGLVRQDPDARWQLGRQVRLVVLWQVVQPYREA